MTACGGVISHQMKGPPAKTVDSVAASCHSHIRGSSVSVKGKHPHAAFLRVSVGCLRVIFFSNSNSRSRDRGCGLQPPPNFHR